MPDRPIHPGLASSPGAFTKMGCALMGSGQGAKAAALVKQLLSRSSDPALASAARVMLSHRIPHWHGAMLADEERNAAFERAISRAVRGGGTVLDIGAGSGLLSLMAARAGAGTVYACEADGALAATAEEIAALNGYSGTLRLLARRSTELDRDRDLGGGADVVVGEVFSDDLINEGALATFEHAVAALGKAGAQIIPAAASIRIALAYRDFAPPSLGTVRGFDLTAFENHLPPERKFSPADPKLVLRSDPQTLFDFDLRSGGPFGNGSTRLELEAVGGTANGVVRWIRLQLDEEESYENAPGRGVGSHWAVLFWPLPGGELQEGESLLLEAAHDRERLHLWVP